jgi:hypothetical protein
VIDILTPEIGIPKSQLVYISQFNTYATPFDSRPGSVISAYEAAENLGKKFLKHLKVAACLLPDESDYSPP